MSMTKNTIPSTVRVHVGRIEDKYVLGILCELFGLAEYAVRMVPLLHDETLDRYEDSVRLFELGRQRVIDDEAISYKDVAGDLWHLYNYSVRNLKVKPKRETRAQQGLMTLIRSKRGLNGERIARDVIGWYSGNKDEIEAANKAAIARMKEVIDKQVKERDEEKYLQD